MGLQLAFKLQKGGLTHKMIFQESKIEAEKCDSRAVQPESRANRIFNSKKVTPNYPQTQARRRHTIITIARVMLFEQADKLSKFKNNNDKKVFSWYFTVV